MELKLRNFGIILLTIMLFGGCNNFNKLLKSTDYEKKYEAAIEYYNKKDYFKAIQLIDELLVVYRTDIKKSENLDYLYANSYYQQGDYVLASYYFHKYAVKYPRNERAATCYYMSAYCKYLDSPKYSLDQTSTFEAISQLQSFIDIFPESDSVARCNTLIDELRSKLEKKDFEVAKLYYKTEYYKSALYALDLFLKQYPTSPYKEEAMLLKIESAYIYGEKSVLAKREERLQEAKQYYQEFIELYPNSVNKDRVEALEENINIELAKIKK
jgi:outer membrane protein assembly factor BamD